jgi:H+/Cl- antiporter ClcA
MRSRAYLRLLVIAAVLGVPISALAWGYLALVSKLQHWLFTSLPSDLGFRTAPEWWPFPLLFAGGILVAVSITYLPGPGGHSPADGLKVGGLFAPKELLGVFFASMATLAFGAVLGPEAPLIALGGGVAAAIISRAKAATPQVRAVVGGAGSFAAISTLFGNPIASAFLLMEAVGLGGPTLELILVPGLLAAGVGALIFIGLGVLSGLGTFSLAVQGLPHFARPDASEFAWALVIGLAAAVVSIAVRKLALVLRAVVQRQPLLWTPIAGLSVAGAAVIFDEVTGKGTENVLFSGQDQLGPLITHAASYSVGALALLLVMKGLAYSASMSGFRGGPTFPAMFIGAVGTALLSHLPGLALVPAVGMGMGAMVAGVLRLPLTAVLLSCLFLASDGIAIMPVVIVAVVTAYIAVTWLDPPELAAPSATAGSPGSPTAAAAPASATTAPPSAS